MSEQNPSTLTRASVVVDSAIIMKPTMPVDIFVQEVSDLAVVAQEDVDKLTAIGVSPLIIDELSACGNALRQAEADWIALFNIRQGAQHEWYSLSPKGYEVRNDLIAFAKLAFRKHPELLKRIKQIEKGTGDADMIQDISDIATLLEMHADLLQPLNFDMTRITEARELGSTLAKILSESRASDKEPLAKRNRDEAFTKCKILVDEIRDFGKYIFRNDPDRLEKYRSAHGHDHYVKYVKNKSEPVTPPVAE